MEAFLNVRNFKSPKKVMEPFFGIKTFKTVMVSFFRIKKFKSRKKATERSSFLSIKNFKSRKAVVEFLLCFKNFKSRQKVTVRALFQWSLFIKLPYDDQIS